MTKFSMGQRVVVKPDNFCGKIHEGYYGHIVEIHEPDPAKNTFRNKGQPSMPVGPKYHQYKRYDELANDLGEECYIYMHDSTCCEQEFKEKRERRW